MTDYKKEEYWSKFANTFDEDQRYIVGEAIQQVILDRLSGESDLGELIELGCGAGFYTKVLAANASHITATDLSDEMVEVARTRLKDWQNISIEKADCDKPDFPDGKFNCVFMANLIHVIENPSTAVRESYRMLKDGGLLLIVDYTGYGMKWFDMMILGIRFLRKWSKPSAYSKNKLSPDELRSLVESIGFTVEEVELLGDKVKGLYLKARKG